MRKRSTSAVSVVNVAHKTGNDVDDDNTEKQPRRPRRWTSTVASSQQHRIHFAALGRWVPLLLLPRVVEGEEDKLTATEQASEPRLTESSSSFFHFSLPVAIKLPATTNPLSRELTLCNPRAATGVCVLCKGDWMWKFMIHQLCRSLVAFSTCVSVPERCRGLSNAPPPASDIASLCLFRQGAI